MKGDLLSGMVIDQLDQDLVDSIAALGIRSLVTDTIMRTTTDRQRLAALVLEFGKRLGNKPDEI
jgi:hypothetical protein